MNKVTILFLAANPLDTDRLRLDEEIRAIEVKLRASEYRDRLHLVSVWAVRPDDLLQSLNEHKPDIVHFSGHGTESGTIVLDDNGVSRPLSAQAIKSLFTTMKDNVRVVVLNACYSRMQSEAITSAIDCAIGMRVSISDRAAIVFAASFYRAIGFGRSIQEAFDQGTTAMLLEGLSSEGDTPEIICRTDVDPSTIILIKPVQSPPILKSDVRLLDASLDSEDSPYEHFVEAGRKIIRCKLKPKGT